MKKKMLSGVKPTNYLTLGNYLGAIKNWVNLQSQFDCVFLAVDLHSITVRIEPEILRKQTYYTIASYIAAGIDPNKCILAVQSHIPAHAELAWVLNCFSYMGELNRMTQFKDKSSKAGTNIPTGLFTYPVLMAADILIYQADVVPVGEDQKQHIELTRDIAIRLNNIYKQELFKIPEPFIPKIGARIMDLQDPTSKMGKSDSLAPGAVYLSDSDDEISKKIKRAVTDSGTEITFEDSKPGIQNLLTIQSALTERPITELVESYRGKQYGHLKTDTAQIVVDAIRPIRKKTNELLNDLSSLDQVIKNGAERAATLANHTLNKVKTAIGFIP